MKKAFLFFILLFFAGGLAFGQKTISLKEVKTDPNPVKQGRYIKITAEFTGKKSKIKDVKIYSREYGYEAPEMVMTPGEDKKTNFWFFEFQIPYEVPAGTYHLELKVTDKKGHAIVDEKCTQCVYGKTGEFQVTVTN